MPAAALDPRLHAYRDDLAAAALRDAVAAPRYVEGRRRQVAEAVAPVRRHPRFDAPLDTEALHGEQVIVYDEGEGWAWCQLERDGYVGYLPAEALSGAVAAPTHRVAALRTYVYPAPDIKAPPLRLLSLNARLAAVEEVAGFLRLAGAGYVSAVHAAPMDRVEPDFVAVAERLVGTPYLWGGRTSVGLDCSALVQLSLEAAGRDCPRDTDMQCEAVGRALPLPDGAGDLRRGDLQRGDLVFWKGHVAIMIDGARLVHANARHMQTTVEPLSEVAARDGGPIVAIRRI